MEQRVKLLGRASAGHGAGGLDRRHRGDQVIEIKALGPVDGTGIADRHHIRAIIHRTSENRHRGQPAVVENLDQRKIIVRRIGDYFAAIADPALRGDDADDDRGFLTRDLDHMGVGHNLVRRDHEAAAMADKGDLVPVLGSQHDPHDRAACGADIGGIGLGWTCQKSGRDQKK